MEKISVSVRVRPLDSQEAAKGGSSWKISGKNITLCNANGAPLPNQAFTFDNVFGHDSSTEDIYAATTKDIVASAVNGFNGTVFAYGQTSSGKTYTMLGTMEAKGIIPLAVHDVFNNLEKAIDREFLLRMSYMEIYNEEINDLLAPGQQKLQIHESLERGIFVWGLREEIVMSPVQVLQLMEQGEARRHVGETNMNLHSSRSHTIFRMIIESRDRSEYSYSEFSSCDAVRLSVLNLVDLAGSERVAKTGAEGARLKEGTHINKSLMTLGTVINKLSEGIESQGGHVPYRDSKLTRILQPALGGNARTAIICNITPASAHVDESRGTLQFASRAMRVTNCAQVNEILTDAALLKRQRKEIEELHCRLKDSYSEQLEEEILNIRNTLRKKEIECERVTLELQEEKKACAKREHEQDQKIENLSSLILSSVAASPEVVKQAKKIVRRKSWCSGIPCGIEDNEDLALSIKGEKANPQRSFPLPPPFEQLLEENRCQMVENLAIPVINDMDESKTFPECGPKVHLFKRRRACCEHMPPLSELVDQDCDVKNELVRCRDELKVALKEIDHLKNSKAELKTSLTVAEEAVKCYQAQLQEMCTLLEAAQSDQCAVHMECKRAVHAEFCNKEESKVINDLKRENEELAMQLTDAYLQFEEEKAAWTSMTKSLELQKKPGGRISIAEKEQEISDMEERIKETTKRLELAISDKNEVLNQIAKVSKQLSEARLEIDCQRKKQKKMVDETDQLRNDISLLHERIRSMESVYEEERTQREFKLKQLRLRSCSLEDQLKCKDNDHIHEMWQLQTGWLKLQIAFDAMSAKAEVFQGRWLEALDELKDLQEVVDQLNASQQNCGLSPNRE